MRTKKTIICLLITMLVMMLSGCLGSSGDYKTPEQILVEQSAAVMKALEEGDAQALKELFCPYIQDNHDNLDTEIEGLFDFIYGDIISYDELRGSPFGGTTMPEDGWVERFATGEIENITTSTNHRYHVMYEYYMINNNNPELLGITYIELAEYDEMGLLSDNRYHIECDAD